MDSNQGGKIKQLKIEAKPSLAIIIPVYNEVKALPCALNMLKGLLDDVSEIIFVDGGSTDGSGALIQDSGFKCLQSDAGRAQQMSLGIRNSTSDIIVLLHIDTLILSSNLSNIKKSYNDGFLSGRFDVSMSNNSVTYQIISFFINMRSRLSKIHTGDQVMFVRRDILKLVGGIPELPIMEDIALSKKLRKLGKVACLRDKVITSSRRWESHGVFKTVLLMWKMRFLYWYGVRPERLAALYRDTR